MLLGTSIKNFLPMKRSRAHQRENEPPLLVVVQNKGGHYENDTIEKKSVIWVSFDIEIGGPNCGIIQLSAVLYD